LIAEKKNSRFEVLAEKLIGQQNLALRVFHLPPASELAGETRTHNASSPLRFAKEVGVAAIFMARSLSFLLLFSAIRRTASNSFAEAASFPHYRDYQRA